jgi:hypothetical protein
MEEERSRKAVEAQEASNRQAKSMSHTASPSPARVKLPRGSKKISTYCEAYEENVEANSPQRRQLESQNQRK